MPTTKSKPQKPDSAKKQQPKGLEGVIASETVLSLVDGVNSKLYYRGIPVNELVDHSTYEETVYLLWKGELPKAPELEAFKKELASHRALSPELLRVIETYSPKAHPMAMLRTMVSALALFDSESENINVETSRRKAVALTAVLPTIIAAFCRLREGKKPLAPDPSLGHAANFLYMMHGDKPGPEMEKALDAYLILLADHGLNASTFSARVTTSTQSDIYSAITSAVGTLKGDLHGSANQRAMEMILDIGEPDKAEDYVRDLLKQKKKVMGFGHRIYKKQDPRAEAFRAIAKRLLEQSRDQKFIEISNRVEKVMWDEKKIPCNVDFFSASVLYVLGFPVDFFTTVFAASRVAGWTAHVIEQQSDNRLIRPAAAYTGKKNQHYIPIEKRS